MMQRLHIRAMPLLMFKALYEAWNTSKQYLLFFAGAGVAFANTQYGMSIFLSLLALFVIVVTCKGYLNYQFSINDQSVTLRHGVFKHRHATVNKAQVERFENKTGLVERLFGVQTILLFVCGSASPVMTLSYLTHEQSTHVIDSLGIQSSGNNGVDNIRPRWWLGVFAGAYFPYLTLGIVIVTPLFMALNVIHSAPTPNPVEAKGAITDTIALGLIPLLVNMVLVVPFYIFICFIGRLAAFLYKFTFAQFYIDPSGKIEGETGLFNRHRWSIKTGNVQYFKVETSPLLERFGFYNLTIMPVGKSDCTMLIPGVDQCTLDKLLALKSISPLNRVKCDTPPFSLLPLAATRTFLLYILPVYAVLAYMLPTASVETIGFKSHLIIIAFLFFFTALWALISHRNNRIDKQELGVVIGERTLSRCYYCFSKDDIKAQASVKSTSRLYPYSSHCYHIGHSRVTAFFS